MTTNPESESETTKSLIANVRAVIKGGEKTLTSARKAIEATGNRVLARKLDDYAQAHSEYRDALGDIEHRGFSRGRLVDLGDAQNAVHDSLASLAESLKAWVELSR